MTKKRSSYKLFFPPIPELLHGYNERKNLSTQYKYISSILHTLHTGSEKIWRENGEKQALKIFHTMAKHVPAYKDFLKKNNISPSKIKKFLDFLQVPITNKENYLQHYPIRALCWKGKFVEENWMISSTSGSTGKPFYFPRNKIKDEEFTMTLELTLRQYYNIDKKSTLFIDCFALGVWIGGMFMYQAVRNLVNRGDYALSMITPGADRFETLKAIKALAPQFDQVILGGYGPLIKDLLDDGIREGIEWKRYNMKYFFAAEGFTEGFRDYLKQYGGVKDIFRGTLNHYGTADLGTMAHETPLSILVRRMATEDKKVFANVFSEANRVPTLAQFIPELFFFEQMNGRLICSGLGGIPLIRYDLKDRGEVLTFNEIIMRCNASGRDLFQEVRKYGLQDSTWQLPFVYLYERDDFTVSIYSVNIYPESIRRALESKKLEKFLTGKFTMSIEFDENQNQFLQIVIEMKSSIKQTSLLKNETSKSLITKLNE